jgi:plastocyanin
VDYWFVIRLCFAGWMLAAIATMPATAPTTAPANTTPVQISIDNFTFSPARLTVKAGQTVTWVNRDDVPHTVVANDRSFKSEALDTDDHYSHAFTATGTYRYFCSIHPHMTGEIVVVE